MKTIVSEQPCNQPLPFPKLMQLEGRFSGQIILFTERTIGTVVTKGYWPVGTYRKDWVPEKFKDFYGSVCLENDK